MTAIEAAASGEPDFEPMQTVTFTDLDSDGFGAMAVNTVLKPSTPGERSWWHVYVVDGEHATASMALKQAVAEPPPLTMRAALALTGMHPDDSELAELISELGLPDEADFVTTFDAEPSAEMVEELVDAHLARKAGGS